MLRHVIGGRESHHRREKSAASRAPDSIGNSIAIEFDTYQSGPFYDPDGNHIGIGQCLERD